MVQHGREHRRHPVHRVAALRIEGREGLAGVEGLARKDHGHPVGGGREVSEDHAEAVVERDRDAERLPGLKAHGPGAGDGVVDDVAMGKGRPLRRPGGPRGELDVDRIVRPEPPRDRVEPPALAAAPPGHHLVEAEAAGGRVGAELDDGTKRGQALGSQVSGPAAVELRRDLPQHLEIGRGLELAGGDERLRANLVESVPELRGAVGGVDVDENEADAGGRELRDQPLGPVRGPDPDPVPPIEAKAEETGREPVHPAGELRVGPALPGGPEDGGGAAAMTADDLREEGGDGRVDERPVGRPLDVGEAVHWRDAPLAPRPGRHLTRHCPRRAERRPAGTVKVTPSSAEWTSAAGRRRRTCGRTPPGAVARGFCAFAQ